MIQQCWEREGDQRQREWGGFERERGGKRARESEREREREMWQFLQYSGTKC